MNADVVRMLEMFLGAARRSELDYVTLIGCRLEHDPVAATAGTVYLEPAARDLAKKVSNELTARIINRQLPHRNRRLGADHVCYNCSLAPMTYDFLAWLIDAEMTRVREGAPSPLRVGFFFGRDGKEGLYSPESRLMFENVMRPALGLLGATEDRAAIYGRSKEVYTLRDVVKASKAGEPVPHFSVPPSAPADDRFPVTITLREAEHWPHRNSNIQEWLRFAHYLQREGEHVVFVRDTAMVDQPFPWPHTNSLAATDLRHRMSLYQRAKANFFVSNGPAMLALFTERPYVHFTVLDEAGAYWPNRPSFWREHVGIEEGEKFPWMNERQRIEWKPDTFENMVEAWEGIQ